LFQRFTDSTELVYILGFYDHMRFNFIEYLKDARFGIEKTAERSIKWMHNYDTLSENSLTKLNSNSEQNVAAIAQEHSNADSTTVRSKQASPKKSPQHVLADGMTNPSNANSFHELDYDPDEFLFNLKINSASLEDPNVKSARSTVNIFSKDETDEIDDEISSLSESREMPKSSKSKSRHHQKTPSSSTKPVKSSEKKPEKPKRAQNPRNRSNDFYVLSFDNELSETESADSTSSSSISLNKSTNNDNIEDNDSTTASLTSNTTINQDSTASTPSKGLNKSVSSLDSTERYMTSENRDRLVEYLFLDEENHQMYMESGLTEFLIGLDRFFRELNIKTSRMKPQELGTLLDQIVEMHDEILNPKKRLIAVEAAAKEDQKPITEVAEESKPNMNNENGEVTVLNNVRTAAETTTSSSNLTIFPVYNGNDSFNSSTDSITTNSQAVDSGIESTKDFASRHQATSGSENDIGPFLSAILNRLEGMLGNSLEVNLMITGLIARLTYYHQNLIRSFLLDGDLPLQPNVKSLIQVKKRYLRVIYLDLVIKITLYFKDTCKYKTKS
jgi:hypothetical protein